MTVRVDRELLTELYFYLLQAERSIDKVLGNHWPDFLNYYNSERVTAIREVIGRLGDLLRRQGTGSFAFNRQEITTGAPTLGIFKYFFGRRIGRWKKSWSFPARELCFAAASLNAVLQLLNCPAKPDLKCLVSLRMNLCSCRSIIEIRSPGLPVLDYGVRIEHLYQSDWISPVSLPDILEGKTRPDQLYKNGYFQRLKPLEHTNG